LSEDLGDLPHVVEEVLDLPRDVGADAECLELDPLLDAMQYPRGEIGGDQVADALEVVGDAKLGSIPSAKRTVYVPPLTDLQDDDQETPPLNSIQDTIGADANAVDTLVSANPARARRGGVGRQRLDCPQYADLTLASQLADLLLRRRGDFDPIACHRA
jgi:hypothetical protein